MEGASGIFGVSQLAIDTKIETAESLIAQAVRNQDWPAEG